MAKTAIDEVLAFFAVKPVVPALTHDLVRAFTAHYVVVAASTEDAVMTFLGVDAVVACAGIEHFVCCIIQRETVVPGFQVVVSGTTPHDVLAIQEVVHPSGHVRDAFVLIAIFVLKSSVHNAETDVINRIPNRVDKVSPLKLVGPAIALHQMVTCFIVAVVVAVTHDEIVVEIRLGPDVGRQ